MRLSPRIRFSGAACARPNATGLRVLGFRPAYACGPVRLRAVTAYRLTFGPSVLCGHRHRTTGPCPSFIQRQKPSPVPAADIRSVEQTIIEVCAVPDAPSGVRFDGVRCAPATGPLRFWGRTVRFERVFHVFTVPMLEIL